MVVSELLHLLSISCWSHLPPAAISAEYSTGGWIGGRCEGKGIYSLATKAGEWELPTKVGGWEPHPNPTKAGVEGCRKFR